MEIARFQAYKAAREFLSLPAEGAPEWRAAFEDDPYEPVENRTITFGSGSAVPTIQWQIDASPPKPTKYMNDRKAAGAKLTWADLPVRINQQKDGLIQYIYGNQIDEYSIGEANLLWDAWRSLDAPKERLADFLKSDHLRNSPFIDIHCTLAAAMDCEQGRQPREGDALDTLIMAEVLPYCDIVATSKDMTALCAQTGLDNKYCTCFYSAKLVEVQNLYQFLAAL